MYPKQLVGIIGSPVSHSLSPAMHNAAFLEAGLPDWCYVPLPVAKVPYIRLKEAVLGLRALSFRGANITVPFKEAALPYVDVISPLAKAVGAINTIVVDAEQRLVGHNTDGPGFIEDLREHGIHPEDISALILGAGGSARAVSYALLEASCKTLIILNRTQNKAKELAKMLLSHFPQANLIVGMLDKDTLKQIPYTDIVVNCTSLGLQDSIDSMPWDDNIQFPTSQIVYDLIYSPAKTKLLAHADKGGAKAINGLGMLLHQGALAFRLWTGTAPSIEAMKKTLQELQPN